MDIKTPPFLPQGGTIGLIAPSYAPEPVAIDRMARALRERGYQVFVHEQVRAVDGRLAGSDAARVAAIHDVFADPSIQAVMCVRGGAGASRLLDKLDYDLIARNPKPFVGFSDITVLLTAFAVRCGFVTYHGPVEYNILSQSAGARVLDDLFSVIGGAKWRYHFPAAEIVREGSVQARLWGGNITLLENLMATPFDWDAADAVLMLEETDEELYSMDRSLKHFQLAGRFDRLKALLVGEMVKITDGEHAVPEQVQKPYGKSLKEMVLEKIAQDLPLAFNVPCGHGAYTATLPIGQTLNFSFSHTHGLTIEAM